MKKYQYIVALSCVLVGAVGFSSMYAISQSQEQQKQQQKIEIGAITGEGERDTEIFEEKEAETDEFEFVALGDAELESEFITEDIAELPLEEESEDAVVSNIKKEVLHFDPSKGLIWPVKGSVLLDYSMDSTIYFPTLQQYKYNPAMVLSGKVNDKVYFIAKGKMLRFLGMFRRNGIKRSVWFLL